MNRRGQGTVELAIGSLLMVVVVLAGIFLSELGVLNLRVQGAAVFAVWSGTGMRAHDLTRATFHSANGLVDSTGADPKQAAETRYRDFDALGSGSSTLTWARASASRLAVTCVPRQVATANPGTPAMQRLAPSYHYPPGNRDGMECNAVGHVAVVGNHHFVEQGAGAFSAVSLFNHFSFPLCAFGRPSHGACVSGVPVAFDDWGLSGHRASFGHESSQCDTGCLFDESTVATRNNVAYKRSVERLYERYKLVATRHYTIDTFVRELFAAPPTQNLMAISPVDERDFRFSFYGEDDATHRFMAPTQEPMLASGTGVTPTGTATHYWPASPYTQRYHDAYLARGGCFLGSKCSRSPFDKH